MPLSDQLNFMKNMKMSVKLTIGFGGVLLLLGIVMAISLFSNELAINGFKKLINTDQAILVHALNMQTDILQCRRHEKNFLLRKDATYLDQLKNHIVALKKEAQSILSLSEASENAETKQQVTQILSYADLYLESFMDVAGNLEKNGLDQATGLQKEVDKIAGELADALTHHQVEDLYMTLMHLRLTEKEYARAKYENSTQRFLKAISFYKKALADSALDDNEKKKQQEILSAYENQTRIYMEKGEYDTYRKIMALAINLEKSLNTIYVPGAMALFSAIERHEKNYMISGEDIQAQQTLAAVDNLLKAFVNTDIKEDRMDHVNRLVGAYKTKFNELVALNKSNKEKMGALITVVRKIEPLIEKIVKAQEIATAGRIVQTGKKADTFSLTILGIGALAIFIGILFSIFIGKDMTRAIKKMVDHAKILSSGDFSKTLAENRKDEMGMLANMLNMLTENISLIITDIKQGIGTLTVSSSGLSAISSQMKGNAGSTTNRIKQMTSSMEEMNSSLISISSAMEESTTNTSMVASAAEGLTTSIEQVRQNTEKAQTISANAVEKAQTIGQTMNTLDIYAQDIDTVTATISEISEQTNLLALNATIEAARAGEAGKGFAVVANEIKALANQTSGATNDIKVKIEGIQKQALQSINQIDTITSVINETNSIIADIALSVDEQSAATREIAENISQASMGIQDVNRHVNQSSLVSGNIKKDFEGISQSGQEINDASAEVNENAVKMIDLADNLQREVERFKVRDEKSKGK